jgi:hypothetical protein
MSDANSDPVEELDSVITEYDVNDERSALSEMEVSLDELIAETKATFESLEQEEQKAVREAFERSLNSVFKSITESTESFKLGEFGNELEDFTEDFRSILHHPEAENTVEDLEDWLVAAGAGPFEEDFREELIEVVESDTDTVDSAIQTAKNALSGIDDDGLEIENSIARLIKIHLGSVNSVAEIESMADNLDSIANKWPYPWYADHPEPYGPVVQTQINDLLSSKIKDSVAQADTLDGFTALAHERIITINETLSEADSIVHELHEIHQNLTETSTSFSEDIGKTILENKLGDTASVENVLDACRETRSILNITNNIASESIGRFERPDKPEESVAFINSSLSRIGGNYRSLLKTQEKVLQGDVDDYDEVQKTFFDEVEEAEENLKRIKNEIEREVETGKHLSEVFELDEQKQSLDEVKLGVSRAESVKQLVESTEECQEIRDEITHIITDEHLDEEQASVFEMILNENKDSDEDLIKSISNELRMDTETVFETILHLKNEGLVSISIEST